MSPRHDKYIMLCIKFGVVYHLCLCGEIQGQSLQPVIESDQIDMILKTTNNLLASKILMG